MLRQASKQLLYQSIRIISTTRPTNFKVAVLGAAGGIGQPLTLLLKFDPLISELALYDIKHAPGVAADVSHIDTYSEITGHLGVDNLPKALRCANIVVIPAGVPRKPGMTRDDLFTFNAEVVKEMACSIAEHCPKALVAIVTNPVNSVVPLAAEIFKDQGMLDPKRLFGVSTLDVVRSSTFVGGAMELDPKKVSVPVICGHSGVTIIPLISQCKPAFKGDKDIIEKLTKRIQEAGTEVVNAKAGAGSATLAMAYAGARFVKALLRGLKGEKNVVECSFVISDVCDTGYFSTPLKLGKGGIEKNLGIPSMNDYENELLEKAIPELKKNIKKGVDFAKGGAK